MVKEPPPSAVVDPDDQSNADHKEEEQEQEQEQEQQLDVSVATLGGKREQSEREKDAVEAERTDAQEAAPSAGTGNTFFKSMQISLHEPVGSMSISPANRDVVLGARKGLFIVDLENPYDQPRFLAHLTTWEVADIQWNPHPARAHWVASTSNQKLLIWNLDRPSSSRFNVSAGGGPGSIPGGLASGTVRLSSTGGHSAFADRNSAFSKHSNRTAPPGSGLPSSHPSRASGNSFQAGSGGGSNPHIAHSGQLRRQRTIGTLANTDTQNSLYSGLSGSYQISFTETLHRRLSPISHVLQNHTRAITDINWSAFNPDIVASCGIDTWTWVWDLRMSSSDAENGISLSGKPVQGYSAWNASATQVKWNRASPHRLATAVDNKVLIWDERKGALPLATIEAHESRIYGIDWARDVELGLDRLVTCSLDGSVKFWDLGNEHAQRQIGRRELVTEPEGVIQTPTPVWRARHLPFGSGVMTLPQRGDYGLSVWSKDEALQRAHHRRLSDAEMDYEDPMSPITRFEGHTDIVKEYLFRTRGGSNSDTDDRKFQLITWSKDQTLRLWPVSEQVTKAVGHKPGSPIRVRFTRRNAKDVSYRIPPSEQALAAEYEAALHLGARDLASSLQGSSTATSQGASLGASASSATGTSSRLRMRQESAGKDGSQLSSSFTAPDPLTKGILRPATASANVISPPSFSPVERRRPEAGMSAIRLGSDRKTRPARAEMSMSARKVSGKDGPKGKPGTKSSAKTRGYMTVGAGHGLFRFAKAAAPVAVDRLTWIGGVRVHDEEPSNEAGSETNTVPSEFGTSLIDQPAELIPKKTAPAHSISDEIMNLSKRLPRVTFEKIEIALRQCVIALYGPWGGREPIFLRIAFTFPAKYPRAPLSYDLERSAKMSLKTRALLLRNLARICKDGAEDEEPSMEACVRFLLGESLAFESSNASGRVHDVGDDDESSEDEPVYNMVQLPPVRAGASFGPHGELVIFRPAQEHPWLRSAATSRAGSQQRKSSKASNSTSPSLRRGQGNAIDGEDRFLASYDALSNAMADLSRRGRDATLSARGSDVLNLMNSDFLARRLQSSSKGRVKSKGPRRDKSLARAALAPGGLKASALPDEHVHSTASSTSYLSSIQALSSTTSDVMIYDVSEFDPIPRRGLVRLRSNSLPHSRSPGPSRSGSAALSTSGVEARSPSQSPVRSESPYTTTRKSRSPALNKARSASGLRSSSTVRE